MYLVQQGMLIAAGTRECPYSWHSRKFLGGPWFVLLQPTWHVVQAAKKFDSPEADDEYETMSS